MNSLVLEQSVHSADHAILYIVDRIQKAVDEQDFSCGIFLDFRKALDMVNHKILINKLEHYGVMFTNGLLW